MGMITRVRGRLRSLHAIQKLDPVVRDEKIAEIVCLLSVLFLLPYCSRGRAPLLLGLGGWFVASYTFLVLPLLISANYKYPVRWLRTLFANLSGILYKWSGPMWQFARQLYGPIDRCETMFMKMSNISNLATQLVFFMLCDRVLLCPLGGGVCPLKRVTGLYTLMFYNVIAYCVSYIRELVDKEDWSVTVNMTHHGSLKHVAMSATKIVLEWTKAITFAVTATFMLLVLGLEQGLDHYRPTGPYSAATWTYYMCTERVFVELFPPLLLVLRIGRFEALEALYAPVILRYYTVALAALLAPFACFNGHARFTCLAVYLAVYLRAKDTWAGCQSALRRERAVLEQFRQASQDEIDNCADDVCAVCLSPMDRARVTPCQHLFHANCLRQCLGTSNVCPICKRQYTFIH